MDLGASRTMRRGSRSVESIMLRPDRWVAVFAIGCVLAFWLSMLVPRQDGSLLGSDGTHYFAYLPSLILDGDLDFTNDYQALLQGEPEKLADYISNLTPTGRPVNVWSIGPAILWAPFFLVAHAAMLAGEAVGLPVVADGYGIPYQAAVLTGSILYGGVGLLWVSRGVRRAIDDDRAAAIGTLVVAVAGNAVYYLTVEPHMSHAVSLFAGGAFFLTWISGRGDLRLRRALLLGALAGLMALIRPQYGLFLVLPYLDHVLRTRLEDADESLDVPRLIRNVIISGLAALVVFSPQLLVWERLWGTFLSSPYSYRGEEFFWLRPRGLAVLFSVHRGLFVWHPVFLVALIGLVGLLRRSRALAITALVGVAMQWYLIASWWAWDQGKSFGGRMFIGCTPFFALGVAFVWKVMRERGFGPAATAGASILILANLIFIPLYIASW